MRTLIIAGVYPFLQRYAAEGRDAGEAIGEILSETAAAGCDGVELDRSAFANARGTPAEFAAAGLVERSTYFNAILHREDWEERVAALAARCAEILPLGVRTVVINPEPVDWGRPLDKDDAALRRQARALDALGARLREQGQALAYHTHDAEMRCGAREFHHMLSATDPERVRWCVDTHWIYRGCGNSAVAVEDVVRLYGARAEIVHVRQSTGGVWSEVFGTGDLDHGAIFRQLHAAGFRGPVVLEQARETGTPQTLPFGEALRRSAVAVRELLRGAGFEA